MIFIEIIALGCIAFVQNMAFTAVSRSRNSGDPDYHRKMAWLSNGIWFVTNIMIMRQLWQAVETGNLWHIAVAGVVYTACTTEGSVLQMKRMLKSETGARRVGANSRK